MTLIMKTDSVLEDDNVDSVISLILTRVDELPNTEHEFVEAVEDIVGNVSELLKSVMITKKETVEQWIELLKNVPDRIGTGAEFSPKAQAVIERDRNHIASTLDSVWPELAGTALSDSGINLQHDSGINLGIL